jgi:hypothetical protein
MLPLASATNTEVRARRYATVGRRLQHLNNFCLLETLLRTSYPCTHALTRKRACNEVDQSIKTANGYTFESNGIDVDLNFLLWSLITHASFVGKFELQS